METTIKAIEKWYQFPATINFGLEVNGKKLTGTLCSAKQDIDPWFMITFNDGHSDTYSIQDWKVYNSADRTDAYSKALEAEIHMPLFSWSEKHKIACIPVEISTGEANAWIISNKDDASRQFDIFILNTKPLTITRNKQEWEIEKTKGGIAVKKAGLEKIKKTIDQLIKLSAKR